MDLTSPTTCSTCARPAKQRNGGCGQFTIQLYWFFSIGKDSSHFSPTPGWSLPWQTTLHVWVPSTGCSPCRLLQHDPPEGYKFCQQTCSRMDSSLHGATEPATVWIFHTVIGTSTSDIHLLQCGVLFYSYFNEYIFSISTLGNLLLQCYYKWQLLFVPKKM